MKVLLEPAHGGVLGSLHTLLLHRVVGVTPGSEAVSQGGEVLVVVLEAQRRNDLVGVGLELLGVHLIVLGGEDLHGHRDGVDLLVGQQRRVGGGDAVDEVGALCAELEDCPSAWICFVSFSLFCRI